MQYNNLRWIEHFRVSKNFIHHLTKKLKPFMERNNMKFQDVVLVSVRVACSFYKLAHVFEYLHIVLNCLLLRSQLSSLSYKNSCA